MPPPNEATPATQVPLAVDLDGTLIRTDMMWESLVRLLRRNPLRAFAAFFALLRGRAAFKQVVAVQVQVDAASVPYHMQFLDWLKGQKISGRKLILATASDRRMAQPIAAHVGLFDEVMASDGKTNLRNAAKRRALNERFGERGYDYAGNSHDDLGVWSGAREAIVVNASDALAAKAAAITKVGLTFPDRSSRLKCLLRALRPHQWVKNLIVFVPLITSHHLTFWPLAAAALACFALCLCASGGYVLNDLLDLEADRHHPEKRRRPFAAGDLPLSVGFLLVPALLAMSVFVAWVALPAFLWVLGAYFAGTCAYSARLKRLPLVDVFTLATLYTLRLVAGHFVTGIEYSAWLLAFSMFIFLSLALMKRFQEIQTVRGRNGHELKGRGYTAAHHGTVVTLGIVSGIAAVVVLGLYVNSAKVVELYARPKLLLLACPLLVVWICRVWLLTYRGKMHDDPTAFAFKDWASYLIGGLTLAVMWFATGR